MGTAWDILLVFFWIILAFLYLAILTEVIADRKHLFNYWKTLLQKFLSRENGE